MGKAVGLALLAFMASSGAAAADRVAYRAIAAGDYAAATRQLEAERRIHPQRPELMLNLAYTYARTGRVSEARSLFAEAMAQPAVALDLPSGDVASSHDLAALGLGRTATMLAAR